MTCTLCRVKNLGAAGGVGGVGATAGLGGVGGVGAVGLGCYQNVPLKLPLTPYPYFVRFI